MAHRNLLGLLTVLAVATACGGEDVPPPAAQPPVQTPPPQDTAAMADMPVQSTELHREVFSYRGSGRDPFESLVDPESQVRPFLDDLRLVSVAYDSRYPSRSIGVLRDRSNGRRYTVRVDDQVGRMRVTEVRQDAVVFTIEDFGVPRQVEVRLTRPGTQGETR